MGKISKQLHKLDPFKKYDDKKLHEKKIPQKFERLNDLIKSISNKLHLPKLEFFYRESDETSNRIYVNLLGKDTIVDTNIRKKFKDFFKQEGIQIVFFHRPTKVVEDEMTEEEWLEELEVEDDDEEIPQKKTVRWEDEVKKNKAEVELEDDIMNELPQGEIDEEIIDENDSAV